MAKTIGDFVIDIPDEQGVLSGVGGQKPITAGLFPKAATAIPLNSIVVTPILSGHADYGFITPLLVGTDFADYRIAGLNAEAVVADEVEVVTVYIAAGLKWDAIYENELVTDELIVKMHAQSLFVTKLVD
jgi:hypothetical protein